MASHPWSRTRIKPRFVPRFEVLEERSLLAALLDPLTQPRFENPLPIPAIMQPTEPGGTHYEVSISQFEQDLGLYAPDGSPLMTTVWGYNGSYPGATFEARSDEQITVHWTNDLVDAGDPLHHLLPVDTTLHWANPPEWPDSGVPVVTHLHGGHSESASDGLPEAWFTPGFEYKGQDWVKETYVYDNTQEAATLWYHDHALGITRLNVYAGLAGFYLLRDDWEDSLNLPKADYEIPLVIQDRMFTEDGELFFPAHTEEHGEEGEPTHIAEFFGDVILVNGKAWPSLDVEPRKYRFRLLNGSDSRVYNLFLSSGQQLHQIGSDGGLLNAPVALDRLTLAPGERADVVVDFSDPALWGQTIVLRNNAKAPFPKGETTDPRTAGQIMAFKVTVPLTGSDTSALPSSLRPEPIMRPESADTTRELLLFEGTDGAGRLLAQLGTAEEGAMLWADPVTENPDVNDVEIWEIYNTTEDTHPIHLHLVQFQVLDRQKFRADQDPMTGAITNIRLLGQPKPPDANESGFKDTLRMNPGEVTRVIATFDREGLYVWHCHILSHEDHEMMRPYYVGLMPDATMHIGSEVAVHGANASASPATLPAADTSILSLTGAGIAFEQPAVAPSLLRGPHVSLSTNTNLLPVRATDEGKMAAAATGPSAETHPSWTNVVLGPPGVLTDVRVNRRALETLFADYEQWRLKDLFQVLH